MPIERVFEALRADHWLHNHPDATPASALPSGRRCETRSMSTRTTGERCNRRSPPAAQHECLRARRRAGRTWRIGCARKMPSTASPRLHVVFPRPCRHPQGLTHAARSGYNRAFRFRVSSAEIPRTPVDSPALTCTSAGRTAHGDTPHRKSRSAPYPDQARRLQVVRRPHRHRHARPARRHRRSERLRQVERDRRGALGARRVEGVGAARRVDAGRHLQRRRRAQAGRPRLRRAAVRQQPRAHRRPVGPVHRDLDQARADARRRLVVLHQQHPGTPPRHPRPLPRHRARPARVRDHRAGHDLARHRGEARGAAHLPRGSRRRFQVQGAAQGNRRPAGRHARESLARRGHPRGARQPAHEARGQAAGRHRVSRARGAPQAGRSTCCGSRSSRTPCARASGMRGEIAALSVALEAVQAELRAARGAARGAAHRALCGRRRAARRAGRVLRGQRGSHAPRAAARSSRARRGAHRAAGGAAHASRSPAIAAQDRGAGRPRTRGARSSSRRALARARAGARGRSRPRVPRCRRSTAARAAAEAALDDVQQRMAGVEQALRVSETRRENARKRRLRPRSSGATRLQQRARGARGTGDAMPSREVQEQLEQENADLAGKRGRARGAAQSRRSRCRSGSVERPTRGSRRAARSPISRRARRRWPRCRRRSDTAQDIDGMARRHAASSDARRLWQQLDIEAGWEDALEAVLRERLNALELDDARPRRSTWVGDGAPLPRPPRGLRAGAAARAAPARAREPDALLAKVRTDATRVLARLLADWLHGVRCRADLAHALSATRDRSRRANRSSRPAGTSSARRASRSSRPTTSCTACSRASASSTSSTARSPARARCGRRGSARPSTPRAAELKARSRTITARAWRSSSQQRRCHDLELELLQLRQAAEAAARAPRADRARSSQRVAARSRSRSSAQLAAHRGRDRATCRRSCTATAREREAARHARNEAEVALARGRERVRAAERATAGSGLRRAHVPRAAGGDRAPARGARRAARAAASAARASSSSERQRSTGRRSRQALHAQLDARGDAEQALARPRATGWKPLGAELRAAEEARLGGRAEARARAQPRSRTCG